MDLNALRSIEVLPLPNPQPHYRVYGCLSLVDWLHAHMFDQKEWVQVERSYIAGDVKKNFKVDER